MTGVMSWRGRAASRMVAGAVVLASAVMGMVAAPTAATAATTAPDGLSSETAAASCWEIKQNDPTSKDGVYWLVTPALVYPQQFFCDQTTDGGGWVLIGRGREGWKEGYNGLGTPSAVSTTPSGTAAFKPAELPAKTVDGLLNNGRVDALPDGIRVRRAMNVAGTAWDELHFSLTNRDRWVWTFGAGHPVKSWGFGYPTTYAGTYAGVAGTTANMTGESGWHNLTFAQRATHGYRMGWAYGGAITGTADGASYLWAPEGKGYAIPFAQVWLRPTLTLSTLDFGTVSVSGTPASTLPAIPSSSAMKTTWGVTGLANGGTGESNVEVADFGEVGGKVFVGGNFNVVQQNKTGTGQVQQPYLAAFDVKTGAWVSTFRPKLNGQVKAIVGLPDGRVAVGGQFSMVNGTAQPGLAFLDPVTGALSGWQVAAEHRATGGVPSIRDFDVQGGYLYVAGAMTHLRAGGSTISASAWNGGRIDLSTGKPDTRWDAHVNGTSMSVDASAQGDRTYFAGYFTWRYDTRTTAAVALQTAPGAAVVSPLWVPKFTSAKIDAAGNYSGNFFQLGVTEVGNRVWLGGTEHELVSYDRNTFERLTSNITHYGGDFQTVETNGSVVVGGCHCGDYVYHDAYAFEWPYKYPHDVDWSEADKINLAGAWDAKSGEYIPDWSPTVEARAGYGAWASFFDSTGTLWVGGDFNRSQLAGGTEQWSGGFVRFAPRDSTAPTTPGAITSTPNADGKTATLTWGASTDASKIEYEVLRGNRVVATTTAASYTVPVTADATNYFVRARDTTGNRSASTAAFVVQPAPTSALTFVGNGATWSWRYSSDPLPADWNSATFDATSWKTGNALFGRGVSTAKTNIDPDALATKPLSAQFRTTFTVSNPATIGNARISVIADDGAVVSVNGVEVGRVRMPAGEITQNTTATAVVSNATASGARSVFAVPGGLLKEGTNVVAASVHANYRSTADLSFDAAFTAQRVTPPAAVTGLGATATTDSATLTWTAPVGGTAAASYAITRDGQSVGSATAPATSFTETGLAAGTAYTYAVRTIAADGSASAPASVTVTTKAVAAPAVSIPAGSTWSWRYSADPLPANWNAVGFDDSTWQKGGAVLARGVAGAATDIDQAHLATKPLSAQFRTTFTVPDPAVVKDGTVTVTADDGVVVYLNGVELGRANLPTGTLTQNSYATVAPRAAAAAAAKVTFTVPAKLLVNGTNVIAASVHANYRSTPDLSYDLSLTMPQ